MDIDLLAVRSFLVLAQTLSFTRAARELFIAPSALTKRISKLERQLGTPLIARNKGGVSGLTPGGVRLAREGPMLLEVAEAIAASAHGDPSRTLRIGIQGLDTSFPHHPRMRSTGLALRALYPGLSIDYVGLGYQEPQQVLRARQADVVITAIPIDDDDVISTRLWALERLGFVSPRHPLARFSEMYVEDFASRPTLHPAGMMPAFADLWSLGDVRPMAGARLEEIAPRSFSDVGAMLESGRGVITLHAAIRPHLPASLRSIRLLGAPMTWYHVVRRRGRNELLVDALVRMLSDSTPVVRRRSRR